MDAMDLEEWEFLSEDGFIDHLHHQNRKGKRVIPRETPSSLQPNTLIDSKGVSLSPNLVIHVPVEFDFQIPESFHSPSLQPNSLKESIPPGNATTPLPVFGSEPEQETVSSQVFFKKARGSEFADMKLDSPKSVNRGLVPQIDLGMPQFEEKEKKTSKGSFDWNEPDPKECEEDEDHGGLNIWKMGMTGIGALCSFGFACATIFVIALSTRKRENKNQYQNQKLCSDEKRMKQVVHHTTKMNDAISALKGIPLNRAHITIGGYFDGV